MTLAKVICHLRHVEAEGTPECFCIQTISANVQKRVFVSEDAGLPDGEEG